MPSFLRFGTDLSEQRHEVICHYNIIPTSLCCQGFLWQNHLKISLQWYRCSGRMVPIPNIRYTRCQRVLWWVCYKIPWVSVIFLLLLDLSSIIYTLLVFDFVVNDYYSTITIFSNNMLFAPRNYIKVVIIYIIIRLWCFLPLSLPIKLLVQSNNEVIET